MKKAKGPHERKIQIGLPADTECVGHLQKTGHLILETIRPVNPDLTRDVRELLHKCCDDIEEMLKIHGIELHPGIDILGPFIDAFQNSMDISYVMEAMQYLPDSHNKLVIRRLNLRQEQDKVGPAFTEKD
tara:strand:+ start:311 stop:700 length:390 start_codon:yes stop_codon:yes gene_type:complete